VLIPCIVLYCIKGLLLPFLVEYSYKGDVNLTHLFCLKDAHGSAHDRGAALFAVGMYLLDPFLMKRRSLLDAVALELLYVTTSLLLTSSL
jgi:hypothetical protein